MMETFMTMTDPNRVIIFDTTLRDGEQSPGCSMNLGEKLEMARALAELSKLEYVNLSVPGTFWSRVTGRVAMLLGQGRNVPNPKGMYTPAGVKKLLDAHPNCDVDQMFDYSSIE